MTGPDEGETRIRPTGKKLFFGNNQIVHGTYAIFAMLVQKDGAHEVLLSISVAEEMEMDGGISGMLEEYAQANGLIYREFGWYRGSYEYSLTQLHTQISLARIAVREHVLNLIRRVQHVIITHGRGDLLSKRIESNRRRRRNRQ